MKCLNQHLKTMADFYDNIHSLDYQCNCTEITEKRWDQLMKNAKRADVYKINKLVKEHLPELFIHLGLDCRPLRDLYWFNPYHYYKTKTHLILVHSSIEYFLKIN